MKLSLVPLCLSALVSAISAKSLAGANSAVNPPEGDAVQYGVYKPNLAMYVQTLATVRNETLSLLPLLEQSTGVTHVIISSFHISWNGTIRLNNDLPNSTVYDQLWQEVKVLQKSGIQVLAMLGGAGIGSFTGLSSSNETVFHSCYDPLEAVLKEYNFNGIDLDIEEKVTLDVALRLVRSLHTSFGHDFAITMAPVATAMTRDDSTNLSGFNYFLLDAQAVDDAGEPLVSWYNTQFYNRFGSAGTPDTYNEIMSHGWDPSRIMMGVLDSPKDGHGYVNSSSLVETIGRLRELYPRFCGISGWDYYDAGFGEGTGTEPWRWVQKMRDALYGSR